MRRFIPVVGLFALLVFAALPSALSAQTYEDAVNAYNQGDELARTGKHKDAIDAFERVINIAGRLEEGQGAEIAKKAQDYIPQLHFAFSVGLFREGKIIEAATAFERTIAESRKYNNTNFAQRAQQGLLQAYSRAASQAIQAKEFEKAIEFYDKTLSLDPNASQAYYNKGLALRNLNRSEEALTQYDLAISASRKTNNSQVLKAATSAARGYFLLTGMAFKEQKKYIDAIQLLNRALEYKSDDAELHYRLAEVYNLMTEHDKAISSANRALELEQGGPVDRARIYFELANALKLKANVPAACEAYKNASFGDFRANAEHAMTHELKCPTNR